MKKNIVFIFICIAISFVWIGCKEKKIHLGNEIRFDKEENIRYGNHPEQVLDLYIPDQKNNQQKEVFIMIHGGGWRGGNKSQLTFFTLSMMQKFRDHIFINMNYRLASATQYGIPNQMNDIQSVVSYIKKKLNYTPKLILLGNSAGGHLSMLYAYHFDADKKVKAVVNIVGPADLSDRSFTSYEDYSFVAKHLVDPTTLPQKIAPVNFASPVHWITEGVPPTLSYYGKKDHVIPLTQKKILDSVLRKNNVIHQSYEFSGGHLDWDKDRNDDFLIDKIEKFMQLLDKK
ncbi:alpha/beta hydrolase fold domain-containing protein [Chryseobacterium sp. Mn2064]|uniref:alpha/beta hydrolase fold domain-containing protein n=1 Tax=Chryseobacterium sp. Mn2064 TaxID=3395263 RepID=UPI003BD8D93C